MSNNDGANNATIKFTTEMKKALHEEMQAFLATLPNHIVFETPDCKQCAFSRRLGLLHCRWCEKQLRLAGQPLGQGEPFPNSSPDEKLQTTVTFELDPEVKETLRSATEAVDQALTALRNAFTTPYELMREQLIQLRKLSEECKDVHQVTGVSYAMVSVFRAMDDYLQPDELEFEELETEDGHEQAND